MEDYLFLLKPLMLEIAAAVYTTLLLLRVKDKVLCWTRVCLKHEIIWGLCFFYCKSFMGVREGSRLCGQVAMVGNIYYTFCARRAQVGEKWQDWSKKARYD